ncbi:tyrosine-protein phosphatase non-receptor type 14 isoform X4 [Nilaparvata lugens]|uniref:tyrosine-protein phosphatase non-receptor type 14 isoform X4 n=1 Tax=Nilaparvata lugens TaxID=108931 RepID=UPI00193E15A7|nr:tyrosine-protein phosphatase non-receptor type 14 isoform X4 [Nilaparvata lugens]
MKQTMPFKLRLKKSRQYNVVSKSLFVICVELLDSTNIECTLSAESVGRECLDNVCQRLGLNQQEFFGLRYINRDGAPRWMEMERPLKRQLDKHAREPNLYLRVMYYVSGVSQLHDEMTRYHYFLQLKNDVIEGRISCDAKQAVLLASYSMQAEFGNHDLERHTAKYLRDFALFPKHLTEEGGRLESLTEAAILQHAGLAGLAQGTAEEYYILAAQQLDGYGHETFLAKDESGNEVVIGVSLSGIVVASESSQASKFYRWKDITNVINHKRHFGMVCQSQEDSASFTLIDVETAKYIWRMCVHQHKFFMQNEQASDTSNTAQIVRNLFSQTTNEDGPLGSSREELDGREVGSSSGGGVSGSVGMIGGGRDHGGGGGGGMLGVGGGAGTWDVQRAQSASCLDLAASHDLDKLRSLLPSYRPAPDYETAMQQQQKYHSQPGNSLRGAVLYSSQPEIHQTHLQEGVRTYRNAYKHYPDVARVEAMYIEQSADDRQQHTVPNLHTYSTPDLESQVVHGYPMLHLYKPPPPYPINRPSSNSTPDLASQTLGPPTNAFISGQHLEELRGTFDDRNIMYIMGRGHGHGALVHGQQVPYTNNQFSQKSTQGGEPIYENVPLPWAGSDAGESRSRASSIQSAPEMSRTTATTPSTPATTPTATTTTTSAQIHKQQSTTAPAKAQPQSAHAQSQATPLTSSTTTTTTTSSSSSSSSTSQLSQMVSHNDTTVTSADSSLSANTSSGTNSLGKQGKGRRKWGGLLGGGSGNKPKAVQSRSDQGQGPRLPLSPTISKEMMCQLLERKLSDTQLFFEFEKIPKQKANPDFTTAQHPDNASRNRFSDALPYEENRVRLTPCKENKMGYVNASHITASVGSHQRFYIAAQSPLPQTVSSFWQMVWEADVHLVVGLGQHDTEYWPTTTDRCLHIGEFEVWGQFSQETGHCVTTKLRLYHAPTRRSRGVWHLQYSEWGDQGCPKTVPHFLGFIEEMGSVRQHTVSEIPAGHNRNPPILIHCSSAVGLSAVLLLSDLLLYTLDHNQELDIPRVVSLLRQQRMLMVQSVAQYRFVHVLLIYYLKNSRLI